MDVLLALNFRAVGFASSSARRTVLKSKLFFRCIGGSSESFEPTFSFVGLLTVGFGRELPSRPERFVCCIMLGTFLCPSESFRFQAGCDFTLSVRIWLLEFSIYISILAPESIHETWPMMQTLLAKLGVGSNPALQGEPSGYSNLYVVPHNLRRGRCLRPLLILARSACLQDRLLLVSSHKALCLVLHHQRWLWFVLRSVHIISMCCTDHNQLIGRCCGSASK
jgi:hypothetical protein